ncbi:hypothetical protein Hypma_007227 [Hypsizygus marmoreus]|uniref:Uncharacterized protein n=1 Tax=Hypsizygus marmoreus TaxID=39966 RepID=A0A369KC61_HYPMA|nr:hypothetical protein Hypma_007227 [Hypsizygus marmoreus]
MRDVDQPRDLPSEQDQQQPIPTSAVPPPSTPSVTAVPPPQRKRQSRFDRPLSTPASTAPSLPTSSTSKPGTSGPAALHQAMLDDDPFVPDDIRSPPQEPQGEAELVRDELTQISLPQQVSPPEDDIRPPPPSLYPNHRARPGDRDSDQDRTHSPSEQERSSPSSLTSHRKREPLPPQSARFREISGRPTPLPTDRGGPSQGQVRPPQLSPSQTTAQLPLGPRDAQRSADSNNLPLGPRYTGRGAARVYPAVPTGGSIDREGPGGDRRPSELIHPPPQSLVESAMDIDIPPSEITPSPRISSFEEFPQSGPGMYADRELIGAGDILPRGPRAMSSKGPPRTASTSPVASFGFGLTTGGRVDRSPPPHLAGRANEGGREYEDPRWKDDRRVTGGFAMERGQGRPPRGRNIEYSRVPSAPLSGPNSVPIGNRKGSGLPTNTRMPSNSGPPLDVGVVDTRPPLRPSRSARGRGGGPPLPPRETHEWDDRSRVGSYGSRGRSKSSGPRRDRSLPPFDKHQPLAVNTSVGHEIGPYSGGDQSRFDPSQQPRTWTPRGVAPPHEVMRASFSAGSDGRGAMSPPPSREPSQVSPTWEEVEPRRPSLRSSARQGGSRGAGADVDLRSRQQLDNLPPRGRDSYVPTSEPPRRSGSLEGRLSDRYDEHVIETPRQLHALPPNPALHRDHKSYSPESRRRPPPDRRLRQQEFGSGWADAAAARDAPLPSRLTDVHSNRMFSDQTLHALDDHNSRGQRPPRPRRLPQSFPRQDEPMAMDTEDLPPPHMHPPEHVPPYIHDRPEFARRGHSLLERLSLDPNSESREEMSSQSLQERVQVPSKRDRDEMVDRYPMDSSFDGEDGGLGDGLRKRRKSTKPRKQRRGGGP